MPLRTVLRRSFPIAAAALLGLALSACSSGLSLTQNRARGYEISEDAVKQIQLATRTDHACYPCTSNNER